MSNWIKQAKYDPDNPPDKVKHLSEKQQRKWIHVYNSAADDGDDEETAHKKAWGSVNDSEKKNKGKDQKSSWWKSSQFNPGDKVTLKKNYKRPMGNPRQIPAGTTATVKGYAYGNSYLDLDVNGTKLMVAPNDVEPVGSVMSSWWKSSKPYIDDQGYMNFEQGEENWFNDDFRVGDTVMLLDTGEQGMIDENNGDGTYSIRTELGDNRTVDASNLQKVDAEPMEEPQYQDLERFQGGDPEAQDWEDPTYTSGNYIDDSFSKLQVGDQVRICLIEEGQESFVNKAGEIVSVNGNAYEVEVEGQTDSFPRDSIELMPSKFNPHYGNGKSSKIADTLFDVEETEKSQTGQYDQRVTMKWLEDNYPQDVLVSNLLEAYEDSSEEDYMEGVEWYNSVHRKAQEYADKYDYDFEQMCAVFAVLSPNLFWDTNYVQAIAFIEAHATGSVGNWKDVRIWTPYSYEGKPCGYGTNNEKAWQILETGDVSLVGGEKVQSFFHNFVNGPNDPDTRATVDIWAVRVAFQDPLIKPNIAKDGSYQYLEQAYNTAAEQVGLTPKQFQAVVWVYYKKMYGSSRGSTEYVNRFNEYVQTPIDERGNPDPSQLAERPEDKKKRLQKEKQQQEQEMSPSLFASGWWSNKKSSGWWKNSDGQDLTLQEFDHMWGEEPQQVINSGMSVYLVQDPNKTGTVLTKTPSGKFWVDFDDGSRGSFNEHELEINDPLERQFVNSSKKKSWWV